MSQYQRPSSYHRSSPKPKPSIPQNIDFTFNKFRRSQSSTRPIPRQQQSSPKLYQLEFDYGKLSMIKASLKEAPARINTPVKSSVLNSSEKLLFPENKKLISSFSKVSNFSTKAKFSTKSRCSGSKENSCETTKKRNDPMLVNGVNLKFDEMFNPDEEKKNKTRTVTMLVGGKIINKTIVYPDTSHYLKLCGIKKD